MLNWHLAWYKSDSYDQYEKGRRSECHSALLTLGYKPTPEGRQEADKKGEPAKYDEFCQQIRGAEAAETQAIWARRQFWLGIVSLIAVVAATFAAGAAAFFTWKQANLAEKGLAATIDTARRIERAYVFLHTTIKETISKTREPGVFPVVWYHFHNYGKTPAILTDLRASVWYIASGLPKMSDAEGGGEMPSGFAIAPYNGNDGFLFSAVSTVTDDQIEAARAGNGKIFFWGYVLYRDALGDSHETGFGWEYVFRHKSFEISHPSLNYQKQRKRCRSADTRQHGAHS